LEYRDKRRKPKEGGKEGSSMKKKQKEFRLAKKTGGKRPSRQTGGIWGPALATLSSDSVAATRAERQVTGKEGEKKSCGTRRDDQERKKRREDEEGGRRSP